MAQRTPPAPTGGLEERSIGLPQVLFQSVTHMAPAAAVAYSLLVGFQFAGPTLPLSVLLALGVCLLVAHCVGQLAKHMPSAAGLYAYATGALGRRVGFLVGWVFLLFEPLVAPLLLLVFSAAMDDVVRNQLGLPIPWWVWPVLGTALVFALTFWGIRLSTNVGIALGVFEIAAFLALVGTLIVRAGEANTLRVFDPAYALEGTWSGVFKGVVFSILAFIGFEAAAPLGEEARDPTRTIPRAVVASALTIGLFYLVCAYASVVGWGFDSMRAYAADPDPWRTLAHAAWGGGWVVIFAAIVNSAIANAIAGVNASTRVIYAMGRIGVLPRVFGRTHPVHRTPDVATVAQCGFALVVALALGFAWGPIGAFSAIATCATILVILTYMTVCVGTFVYYRRARPDEFRWPSHGFVPFLGALFLIAPLAYQFHPLPAYPIRWGNWLALAWLAAGVATLVVVELRRPMALATAERIMRSETPEPS
jgi:amino acid transporter